MKTSKVMNRIIMHRISKIFLVICFVFLIFELTALSRGNESGNSSQIISEKETEIGLIEEVINDSFNVQDNVPDIDLPENSENNEKSEYENISLTFPDEPEIVNSSFLDEPEIAEPGLQTPEPENGLQNPDFSVEIYPEKITRYGIYELNFSIKNIGNPEAKNVFVSFELPVGLETAQENSIECGNISAWQSCDISMEIVSSISAPLGTSQIKFIITYQNGI